MERVMVIGCGGSGKSTLSRELGKITGLPVIHLDQIFWSPGNWEHLEQDEFDRHLMAQLEKPRWILDGNFNRTLETRLARCDTVIYLDLPRITCLSGWICRVIKNWGKAREDMAPGCTEWFDPEFGAWIWSFNSKNRERYHKLLSQAEGKNVYILKSRAEVRRFIKTLGKNLP